MERFVERERERARERKRGRQLLIKEKLLINELWRGTPISLMISAAQGSTICNPRPSPPSPSPVLLLYIPSFPSACPPQSHSLLPGSLFLFYLLPKF